MRTPIGKLIPGKAIHIYGAGISGLLMGHFLKKSGYSIQIFEKDNKPGGKISTAKSKFGLVESAANAIYTNDDVFDLLKELNLSFQVATPKLKKKVFRNGKDLSFPLYPREIFKLIIGLAKKAPDINDGTSVADFFNPLLGADATQNVVGAALGGIYAEPVDKLNLLSLFPTLANGSGSGSYFSLFKKLKQSRISKTKANSISFENGMQDFVDALAKELAPNIHYNTPAKYDDKVNNIFCTDAHTASQSLLEVAPDLAASLGQINYNTLSTSTVFLNQIIPQLENSFGLLFPQTHDAQILGILNNSAIFPKRTFLETATSYTFIAKNTAVPKEKIFEVLKKLIGTNFEKHILEIETSPWEKAIPIYDSHRLKIITNIRKTVDSKHEGLIFFGNYVDGISIREMITSAKNFALESSQVGETN